MADAQQLIRQAQVQGRIPSPERARRWLRATASILADWGGSPAREALAAALPRELLSGAGTSGRAWSKAVSEDGDERDALACEAGRRSGEQDPGKVAWSLRACLSLVREQLGAPGLEKVVAALPGPVGAQLGEARWDPPWRYRLVPQPFGEGRRRQREARTGSALAGRD
jgi:uncharacterized protein (DUF2267 family)